MRNLLFSFLLLASTGAIGQTVSTGLYHSLAVCEGGTVMAFGRNDYGQLGIGNTDNQFSPVEVGGLSDIVKADAGNGYFSVFLSNQGQVWMSGNNGYGNFGNNEMSSTNSTPVLAPVSNIVDIAAGFGHTVLVDNAGAVWTAGWGNQGQLGLGNFSNALEFQLVNGLPAIVRAEAGYWHTILLAVDGTVWAMGSNNLGQIGMSNTTPYSNVPIQISGLSNITEISAGSYYSLFLTSDQTVLACGSNPNGQLAIGNYINQFGVVPCIGLPEISKIQAGNEHSLFIDNTGQVWGVGFANFGQNGLGVTTNVPGLIPGMENVISVAASGDGNSGTSLFLKESGAIWGCGSGGSGQLGVPNVPYYATPQFLSGVCGSNLPEANLTADEYILCNELSNCFHLLDFSLFADEVVWDFGPDGSPNEQTEMTVDVCYNAPGTYQVTIEAINDFGSSFDTITLVLTGIPEITSPELDTLFCLPEDIAPYDLSGFNPAGGTYTGTGILEYFFFPELAGIGEHNIVYTVEPAPGCAASVEFTIEVSECQLPIVSLGNNVQMCLSDSCIVVVGESNYADELVWSVPGSNSSSFLDLWEYTLCYSTPGTYEVTLTGTNEYGSSEATIQINVVENPAVSLVLTEDLICYNSGSLVIGLDGGSPEGGDFSGPGVAISDFDAEVTGLGQFIVTYTYSEDGCSSTANDTMFVEICESVDFVDSPTIDVFPNFGAGPYVLNMKDISWSGSTLSIYSPSGELVSQSKIIQPITQISELEDLAEGIYLLRVDCAGQTFVSRVIRTSR
jgi:alpha-tubulin suppressor-like RCC1 family protein